MPTLFYLLFFFVPLILWPYTSELFEFNKMVLVYILTLFICASWIIKMIKEKKIIFRRTILDIPLICFLVTSLLSTIFSIDPRTSLFGYYSRFNGGLLSAISYALLYWAYVSNMDQKRTLSAIRYTLFAAVLVCIYGILEHFGIDKDLWVQDVQNRVFSTLGQPNWLAAYLVALLPISNYKFLISNQTPNSKIPISKICWFLVSILFFITLLFTKSRSGLLGFVIADVIFWGLILWKHKKEYLKQFVICHLSFVIIFLVIGSPFRVSGTQSQVSPGGPALEVGGGTESGEIRKIVWRGAIDIWKHNILLGTGPETFAFSYYMHRPVEHNLVSEWDFIYNKAHNEYLNYLATTGTLGTFSYLLVILFSLIQISNFKFLISKKIPNPKLENSKNYLGQLEIRLIRNSLFAGYISILITNFFGFSVVPVALEFFLFPAMAITLGFSGKRTADSPKTKLNNTQKTFIVISLFAVTCTLYAISCYWYADVLYSKAKQYNSAGKYPEALSFLQQAVKLSPNEALYRNELSQTSASLAGESQKFIDFAVAQSDKAILLSPANINILRNRANIFYKLSKVSPLYLKNAVETLLTASVKAPTDAKIFYNLSLMYLRVGQVNAALGVFEKTILLKPNYKEARLAYALTLVDAGKPKEAKEQLTYILEKIDPNDKTAKEQLNKLK